MFEKASRYIFIVILAFTALAIFTNSTDVGRNVFNHASTSIASVLHARHSFTIPTKPSKAEKDSFNADEMVERSFRDINRDRIAHGVKPLAWSDDNAYIANQRTPQVYDVIYNLHEQSDDAIHGQSSDGLDAQEHLAIRDHMVSAIRGTNEENVSAFGLGTSLYDAGGTQSVFDNHNGKDTADDTDDVFMYHDQGSHDGHRFAILNPNVHHVGIAVKYDKNTNQGVIVEDFGENA